ncbi:MAG: hypothetical protein GTO18_22460 [Anaerolineales bacterium]|nr:hypothetical protein [Anaerolineales bacterium]
MNNIDLDGMNLFLLRKQHLTPDSQTSDLLQIVNDLCGLHATNPTTPFLSLRARSPGFESHMLEKELYEKVTLAKIRCVRKTIFIHGRSLLSTMFAATNKAVEGASRKFMESRGVAQKDYDALSNEIIQLLQVDEMTTTDLRKTLGSSLDLSSVLYYMCDQGLLLRWRQVGGWKSKSHQYALFRKYFPDIDLHQTDEQESIINIVRNYLASFGPASFDDIVWWTGFGKRVVQSALDDLEGIIQITTASGVNNDVFMLRSESESLQKTVVPSEPIINLLPSLDPYVMGYKDRDRTLNPADTNKVFDRSGNATSTIVVNGIITGVWDYDYSDGSTLKFHLFRSVPTEIRDGIQSQAVRLGEWIARGGVRLMECESMTPLTERTAGAMMSPLKG